MAAVQGRCQCGKNAALIVRLLDGKVVRQCIECWKLYDKIPKDWETRK